jgi:hypothetical protein
VFSTAFEFRGADLPFLSCRQNILNKKYFFVKNVLASIIKVLWTHTFLAHLRGAYPINVARFLAAGAIDPKLCTYVPLGKSNLQTKFRSSESLFGHQGPKSAMTAELMAGSSPIFYHKIHRYI